MSTEEILKKLYPIYTDIFKEQINISLSTSPKDIVNWDSLNHVLLIKKIEDEFQIEIDLFEVIELKNTGDVVGIIKNKLA